MYEFVCDRLIPGCTYKSDPADHEKDLLDDARDHLHERHDLEYADDDAWLIISKAVIPVIH